MCMFLTKVLHILYCMIIANMTFESKVNNLILVVSLVKQIYRTCFVVDGLYFAH